MMRGTIFFKIKLFFICFFTLFVFFEIDFAIAQNQNLPLNFDFNKTANQILQKSFPEVHTSLKPVVVFQRGNELDSLVFTKVHDSLIPRRIRNNFFWRKIRTEDLVKVKTKDFEMSANILFNLDKGKDRETDSSFSVNTRAIEIKGRVGEKVFFQTAFFENQATFPGYINNVIKRHKVVPGQGPRKDFGLTGHDFSMATGHVSVFPTKNFNLQFGHDRQFIGEGYRSLLLSDNTYPYPFARATLQFGKFQYTWMLTEFQDFEKEYYFYHYKKHGSFTYLSWKPVAEFELALFEGFIWQTGSKTTTKRFDINYFNPIILFRSVQYGLNNDNNALLGLQSKYKLGNQIQIYGQLAVDELQISDFKSYKNKIGYQFGFKCFDAFFDNFTNQKLYLQAEVNTVKPYMYAHRTQYQYYTNLNQSLAHPLGAGFREFILMANYRLFDFWVEGKIISAVTSEDQLNTNYGSNIFQPDNPPIVALPNQYQGIIGQGNKATIGQIQFRGGILINPRTNLNLFAGLDLRNYKTSANQQKTSYLYIGFRSMLTNFYFDF